MLLQLTAAQGPDECALAVAKALQRLQQEAQAAGVDVEIVESQAGATAGSWQSLLLALDGAAAAELAASWSGSLLWICASPLRPQHRRKNWFFGGRCFAPPPATLESEIRFETLRASGPGGQHVNTTASAVRATHVASGISVKVQNGRSQHANRRLAIALIGRRLQEQAEARNDAQRAQRRQAHYEVDRGNPRRVFRGAAFVPD
ncbi:MAG: peptide chain release factor H [Lysobacterales bacterium 69-70]|nr:peptide chain release factor H [Xanthomonadaceae bacterium]ODU35231.1 MAG: peptide chain release factor H [Xanthomonadaceae bacterium SCN 69-320]ODV15766.1 MAG: peptide chain release factor H [Xanthomonadaceae bacterium SCN 69-25]OJY94131.1 MAG: peptide chain release factor H [Xanthomonadales bacterium 69-70]